MASSTYSGRSNRQKDGNLRNFKAMSISKLVGLYRNLYFERNDRDAYELVEFYLAVYEYKFRYENPFD